jgi:aromatic-L-amino-acid decarboxylase
MATGEHRSHRQAPLDVEGGSFRAIGHELVDRLADFFDSLPTRRVVPGEPVTRGRELLGDGPVPPYGGDPAAVFREATEFLLQHSVFTSHPRFWGYINGAASPYAALADLLATALNAQVAAWYVGPAASAIEEQAVRWIAQLVGYPDTAGGLLTSGGTMANVLALAAARRASLARDLRSEGLGDDVRRLFIYATREAHTWLQKAVDLMGMGTRCIRWVRTGDDMRMDVEHLHRLIVEDRASGLTPCCVVATAGTTSAGAVDPLFEIASVCRETRVWLHVDGAYGALAALSPRAPMDIHGLREADSLVIDPHKWMYTSLEAGCVLVRDPGTLHAAFGHHSVYYRSQREPGEPIPYREYSLQTSRGFRALKVWICLRLAGRQGYERMITEDMSLARRLHELVCAHPLLDPLSHGLSITTFRFVPAGLPPGDAVFEPYLDHLNRTLLARLQSEGRFYPSETTIRGKFALRVCIVNFRTNESDIEALVDEIVRCGVELDRAMRDSYEKQPANAADIAARRR